MSIANRDLPYKVIYATVKLTVKDSASCREITSEADYNFEHDDILDTEWIKTEPSQFEYAHQEEEK